FNQIANAVTRQQDQYKVSHRREVYAQNPHACTIGRKRRAKGRIGISRAPARPSSFALDPRRRRWKCAGRSLTAAATSGSLALTRRYAFPVPDADRLLSANQWSGGRTGLDA